MRASNMYSQSAWDVLLRRQDALKATELNTRGFSLGKKRDVAIETLR